MVKDTDTVAYMFKDPDTWAYMVKGPDTGTVSLRKPSWRAADRALQGGSRPLAASLRKLFCVLRVPLIREVHFRLALRAP